MNETIKRFLQKNGFDIKKMYKCVDMRVYSKRDINKIISSYGIYTDKKNKNVSVSNIYGYDYQCFSSNSSSIDELLSIFFDSFGNKYHSRAVGMLEYTDTEIMEKLSYSFIQEPIILSEIEKDIYVVSGNGLHRYNLIRIFYLHEMSQAKSDEEKEKIIKKYTMPVKVSSVDYIKTYCNFLLSNIIEADDFCLYSELDNNCHYTNKSILKINDTELSLSDDELINFTSSKIDIDTVDLNIKSLCLKYPSFDIFISRYFPKLKKIKSKGI